MSPPRTFSYERARKLRKRGWTYREIAELFGVSSTAIYRVCNRQGYERMEANARRWLMSGHCAACGKQGIVRYSKHCRACHVRTRITTVREKTLWCNGCERWLPDKDFPFNRSEKQEHRRFRHSRCRACNTIEKRAWRARQAA